MPLLTLVCVGDVWVGFAVFILPYLLKFIRAIVCVLRLRLSQGCPVTFSSPELRVVVGTFVGYVKTLAADNETSGDNERERRIANLSVDLQLLPRIFKSLRVIHHCSSYNP